MGIITSASVPAGGTSVEIKADYLDGSGEMNYSTSHDYAFPSLPSYVANAVNPVVDYGRVSGNGLINYEPQGTQDKSFASLSWSGLDVHGIFGKHEYDTQSVDADDGPDLDSWSVYNVDGSTNEYNHEDRGSTELATSPLAEGLWFRPYLIDADSTIENELSSSDYYHVTEEIDPQDIDGMYYYYHHERYNTGAGSVQAGENGKGIVSFLPLFDWNQPEPSATLPGSMPVTGISYDRNDNSSYGMYSDRGNGGIATTPASRATALAAMSMFYGMMAVTMAVDNIGINVCRDNTTSQGHNFLDISSDSDILMTNNSFTGDSDHAKYPLLGGSYNKWGFDTDLLNEFVYSRKNHVYDGSRIGDITGYNDSFNTSIGVNYDQGQNSTLSQYLTLDGVTFDGQYAGDTTPADLQAAIIYRQKGGRIDQYSALVTEAKGRKDPGATGANDTFNYYSFGSSADTTLITERFAVPWGGNGYYDVGSGHGSTWIPVADYTGYYPGIKCDNGNWSMSEQVSYSNYLDSPSSSSGWDGELINDDWDGDAYDARGEGHELVLYSPLANKHNNKADYSDLSVPRGRDGPSGDIYGSNLPWNSESALLLDYDLDQCAYYSNGTYEWEADYQDNGGTSSYLTWNDRQGEKITDIDRSAAIPVKKNDPVRGGFPSPATGPIIWLSGDLTALDTSPQDGRVSTSESDETNSFVMRRTSSSSKIDLEALVLTPACDCQDDDDNKLTVAPVKEVTVQFYNDLSYSDGVYDNLVYETTVTMAPYQTSDYVMYFGENTPVKDINLIRVIVNSVWDSGYAGTEDEYGSYTNGTAHLNSGGFMNIIPLAVNEDEENSLVLGNGTEAVTRLFGAGGSSFTVEGEETSRQLSMAVSTMMVSLSAGSNHPAAADLSSRNASYRYNLGYEVPVQAHTFVINKQAVLDARAAYEKAVIERREQARESLLVFAIDFIIMMTINVASITAGLAAILAAPAAGPAGVLLVIWGVLAIAGALVGTANLAFNAPAILKGLSQLAALSGIPVLDAIGGAGYRLMGGMLRIKYGKTWAGLPTRDFDEDVYHFMRAMNIGKWLENGFIEDLWHRVVFIPCYYFAYDLDYTLARIITIPYTKYPENYVGDWEKEEWAFYIDFTQPAREFMYGG